MNTINKAAYVKLVSEFNLGKLTAREAVDASIEMGMGGYSPSLFQLIALQNAAKMAEKELAELAYEIRTWEYLNERDGECRDTWCETTFADAIDDHYAMVRNGAHRTFAPRLREALLAQGWARVNGEIFTVTTDASGCLTLTTTEECGGEWGYRVIQRWAA